MDSLETLPFESLRDWRSYADLVAVVEVIEERSAPDPAASAVPLSDPLRYVTLSFDHVLWTRRSDLPAHVEILTTGWRATEKGLVEVAPADGARLDVGRRYVVGLILDEKPGAMTASSVLPLDGDVIGPVAPGPFAASLVGLTVDELEDRILATKPHPAAAQHEELTPEERYALVRDSEG